MASAIHAGDTFSADWLTSSDLEGTTVQLVLRRRALGALLDERVISAAVTDGKVTAVLPADLDTGDYAVTVRVIRGAERSTAPSGGYRTLTVWS